MFKTHLLDKVEAVATSDRWRSSQFLVLGLIFLWVSYDPLLDLKHVAAGLQDDIHSFAILCLRGTLGYWLTRICLTRLPHDLNKMRTANIREAIVAGFCILARAVLIGMALVSFK
jgi:hypothetical protein